MNRRARRIIGILMCIPLGALIVVSGLRAGPEFIELYQRVRQIPLRDWVEALLLVALLIGVVCMGYFGFRMIFRSMKGK